MLVSDHHHSSFLCWLQDYPEDRDLLARKAAKAKKEAAAKPRTWTDDEVHCKDTIPKI
jgi:hypothetical protein